MNSEFFNIGLPKWPQMRVAGKSVTEEQAFDIILKTDSFLTDPYEFAGGNNYAFNKEYRESSGLEALNALNYQDRYRILAACRKEIGCIENDYVENHWASCCFAYGAHGWCHPNGQIFYEDNIGKWPTVEEVYKEWKKIAKEFPYLELVVTLMNGESCEENIQPLVNLFIQKGKVTLGKGDLSVHDQYGSLPFRQEEEIFSATLRKHLDFELGLPMDWYEKYAVIVKEVLTKIMSAYGEANGKK